MGSVKSLRLKLKICFDNNSFQIDVWLDLKSRIQSASVFKCNDKIFFHKMTVTIKKMRLFGDAGPN